LGFSQGFLINASQTMDIKKLWHLSSSEGRYVLYKRL
jgi:hypothetical protein